MNLDNVICADIEAKDLLKGLKDETDFHILSVGYKNSEGKWIIKSTNKREDIIKVFCNPDNIIVMHNGRRYDKIAIEIMFKVTVTATIIDSLSLAWYLDPNRAKLGKKYGLEAFGEDFGFPKVKVDESEWKTMTYARAEERCTQDVYINILLWEKLLIKLNLIYEDDLVNRDRIVKLLNWIMDCSYKQEENGIAVDVEKTEKTLLYFEDLKEEKINLLIEAMPPTPIKVKRLKPKNMFKKDLTLSVAGTKWMSLLERCGLSEDYDGIIEETVSIEPANPNSVQQKKEWLYSLGWKPETLKHNRNKDTNEVKIVEQIMTEDKMLCPSVLKLAKKEPAIDELNNLTVLTHRIGLLKGFLKNMDENNILHQGLTQLAVSLRWQHGKIVNLPRYTGKGDLRDGKWIRECLIAGEGKKIVQSDLSGIESRTSDHYTFFINPERIKKTQMPFFDPHTEISVSSGLMTSDEEVFFIFKGAKKEDPSIDVETFSELYKPTDEVRRLLSLPDQEQSTLLSKIKNARSKGKTTNYSSLYLVGAETLSRTLDISKKEAQQLIDSYWDIHFAVKEATENFKTKVVEGETWIWNPIARFWVICRNLKNKFSVVNQSSAVYCFNMWVWNCTNMGIFPVIQSHDDLGCVVLESDVEKTEAIIREAMVRTNKQLKLNVELACETQVGYNLAETH